MGNVEESYFHNNLQMDDFIARAEAKKIFSEENFLVLCNIFKFAEYKKSGFLCQALYGFMVIGF